MRFDDRELERALIDLGEQLRYPQTPGLAQAVRAEIEARPRKTGPWLPFLPPMRPLAAGFVALVVLTAAVLTFSPTARAAVAGWLGIPGIRITVGNPVLTPGPLGGDLDLGERVTMAGAQDRVSFHILQPNLPGGRPPILDQPDEMYVATTPPGGRVSLVYHARPGLPRASETGAGLLLTEFQASVDQGLFVKVVGRSGPMPQAVTVGRDRGYWIQQPHQLLLYLTSKRGIFADSSRLAGPTLVWTHHGLTLRLESALSEAEALRLAASVR